MAKLTPIQRGLLRASKKFIELAVEGAKIKKVPKEVQQKRIKICEGCDKFDPEDRACTSCGCDMDFKTQLEHDPIRMIKNKFQNNIEVGGNETRCPLEKW